MSVVLDLEGPQKAGAQITDVAGCFQVTIGSGSSDNVLGLDEVGVNELVRDIFRSKVSALAGVPIDLIPWLRIKELAAKCVMHYPNHVLSAKTETPAISALVQLGPSQAELASAFTVALASVFGVKRWGTLPIEPQFLLRELTSGSV